MIRRPEGASAKDPPVSPRDVHTEFSPSPRSQRRPSSKEPASPRSTKHGMLWVPTPKDGGYPGCGGVPGGARCKGRSCTVCRKADLHDQWVLEQCAIDHLQAPSLPQSPQLSPRSRAERVAKVATAEHNTAAWFRKKTPLMRRATGE